MCWPGCDLPSMLEADDLHIVYDVIKSAAKKILALAKKDLGWHSVEESLPEIEDEVIVLTDELNLGEHYKISFAHRVNPEGFNVKIGNEIKHFEIQGHDGWNIPGVKYWMQMPKIPKEEQQ